LANALLLVLALLAAVGGMSLFALSLEVHFRQALGSRAASAQRRILKRRGGAVLLLGALIACHLADHTSLAWLIWFMLLAVAQVLVAFVLAFVPHAFGWLARRWG